MRQFQLLTFPPYVFEQYSCQTYQTLYSGGQDRQDLFVTVEVSSSEGNFDTPRKPFFATI
jgi:hypothetical protein